MFRLSYQGKNRLKRLALVLGILALVAVLVWFCWVIWLQRYIVFSRDGVRFDFDRSTLALENKTPHDDAQRQDVPLDIYVYDGENATLPMDEEAMRMISGVYVDTRMLLDGIDQVEEDLAALEPDTAILLDVKSIYGNYYYSTSIYGAQQSTSIDQYEMDALIAALSQKGHYLIARLPAFRDTAFALDNQRCGLPLSSGVLWTDDDHCYWLNPTNETVLNNLTEICKELQSKGFDEVVFYDFYFPESGKIVYQSDIPKDEAIKLAAERLVSTCTNEYFLVSFVGGADFPLPVGQTRLYIESASPEGLESFIAQMPGEDTLLQTVFLAETRDTRFDGYCVLRALQRTME